MSDDLAEPTGTVAPPDSARPPDRSEPPGRGHNRRRRGLWLGLGGIVAAGGLAAGVIAGVSGEDDGSTSATTTPPTAAVRPPTDVTGPPGFAPTDRGSTEGTAPSRGDATASPSRGDAVVPYVISVDEASAVAQLEAEGWNVEVVEQLVTERERDGFVVDQIPSSGIPLEAGSTVTLRVNRFEAN